MWIDLSALLPNGELFAGQTTAATTITFSNPSGLRLSFKSGVFATPAPNAAPVIDSAPVTTATAGQPYRFQVLAHDPNHYGLGYLLVRGPAGMSVDPSTGLVTWLPTVASPAQAAVVLRVDDSAGSDATLPFTITVSGVDLPPAIPPLPTELDGQEGQNFQFALGATDPQGLPLFSWAENLPPGAVYDTASETLSWLPGALQAGTYPNVEFFVSDGVKQSSVSTTLLIAQAPLPPTLVQPSDQTILEGQPIHIALLASDPNGDPLTYSSTTLPGGATLDPMTGAFDWAPGYFQHGVYQVPFTVGDGVLSTTVTTTITVLNVDAPPVFNDLGSWSMDEGQQINFRAFALDPNNPGFIPQERLPDGSLTPLEGTAPTISYTVSGLPAGATFDPQTDIFNWQTGYTDAGRYLVTFTATNDGDGTGVPLSATVSVPITIINVNRAPQITFIANQTVNDATTLTLPVQAVDPDGDPMVLTASGTAGLGLPAYATFVDNGDGTGTFTFSPTVDDSGSFTITLSATDNGDGGGPAAALSASQSFVVTVNNPNRPPHLAAIGDKVAVAGKDLQFTIVATDLDQDPLTFGALGLPPGATLTPSSTYGETVFDWTPTSSDLGRSTVVFTVVDNGNGNPADVLGDQQSINLVVRQNDQAPVLVPMATQTIAQQQTLTLPIEATDPDGDPLLYSATGLPPGATFDPVSGVITWAPNLFQSGTYGGIVVGASDGYLTTTEPLTIYVITVIQPPKLVPLVEQDGSEGTALQFTIAAGDPSGGPLSYSAISGLPADAQFNAKTGQFNWTPNYDQSGDYSIVFGVTGPGGLTDQTDVKVHIDNVDRPPFLVVTSHQAAVGQPLSFTLQGSDPDQGTVLTYSALGLPQGATLDAHSGAVSWTPGPAQVGDYDVQFAVSDGELTTTQTVVLRGEINPVPPQLLIELTPSFPAKPGQAVLVHVAASSLAPITGLTLTIAGKPVVLDSQGRATYTPTAPGRIAVSATGTDADGLVGQFATVIKVVDPLDQSPPAVAFSPQLANARLTASTAIVGTVSDTNLDSWVLDRAPVGSSTFTTLASGNSPVSNATLATLDPTAIANGPYVLRLTATDIAGRTGQTTVTVEADTATKPTQYLRGETDLSVSLAGSVFNLVRSYDSLDATQSGTFGNGWRLASQDVEIQTTVPPTGLESSGIYNPFLIGTRVYLTLPTGQRVGFTFTPVKHQINGLTYYTPAYTADAGVAYTLTSAGGPLVQAGNRYDDLKTGLAYNPAADLYAGPEYTITAPDGTTYDVSTARGVQEIIRPDGSSLTFNDSGITASNGQAIVFTHDASGRITSAIAPDGTRIVYTYDAAGNLVSARNLAAGQSSRYGYESASSDRLIEAVSPTAGTSVAVQYAPAAASLPIVADLGSSGQFLASDQSGTLATGGTNRYAFSFEPSEIQATTSGEVFVGISVQAASGSSFQPAIPAIAGLVPVASHTTAHGSFALYAITKGGLELLSLSGANGSTSGAYTLHLFVAGDVNGDGKVDGNDVQLLGAAPGTSVGQSGYLLAADANQDGTVNAADDELLAADLGFQAALPPVASAGQAVTHIDLPVSANLANLATDPAGNPIYFRVLDALHGTVTLSSDGLTATFVPAAGYTGPASFQYVADDGYGTSAPATISVTVSSAVLVGMDFQQREPRLQAGNSEQIVVTGEFSDGTESTLPASYFTITTISPSIASVSASGLLTAVSDGTTVLIVSSHGVEAVTAVTVGVPTDPTQQGLYAEGLTIYPATVSLPSVGGSRQIDVSLQGNVDLAAASTGTLYYVSNTKVIAVTKDGLITSVGAGDATVTVINGPATSVIHVHVEPPRSGPVTIGAAGGVVAGSDGSLVQIAPNALPAPASVSITPVTLANLPIPVPSWLSFAGAVNLQLGSGILSEPVQLAIPMPGVPAGTTIFLYRADSLPDDAGVEQPIWMQVDTGVVGSDGYMHTNSPPFKGVDRTSLLLAALSLSTGLALISVALIPLSLAGILAVGLGAAFVAGGVGVALSPLNLGAINLPLGPNNFMAFVIPKVGPPNVTTGQVTVAAGVNPVSIVVDPSPDAQPPVLSQANLQFSGGSTVLVIDGSNFGDTTDTVVNFQTGSEGQTWTAQPVTVTSTEITVNIPHCHSWSGPDLGGTGSPRPDGKHSQRGPAEQRHQYPTKAHL